MEKRDLGKGTGGREISREDQERGKRDMEKGTSRPGRGSRSKKTPAGVCWLLHA